MFILHSSNKTENLLAHLCTVIETTPLSSPFAKEVFLIQSQGMERWLSQQLASYFKVFGNYQFLFPGKFFSSIAQDIDSRLCDAAFERHSILWRLEALLRKLEAEEMSPLRQYLSGENTALKRYQLAQQLSQLFDQYQMMRPELLSAWQKNQLLYQCSSEIWQKTLWQQITLQTGHKHRGCLWLEVIDKLAHTKAGTFDKYLPERISVFGINTMPPLFLKYLEALAKHCHLHLFLLNPAQIYWADLSSKRQLAKNDGIDSVCSHPLLTALGQQGREFQEMLLEQETAFDFEPESFEENEAHNNLQQLQNDILNNCLEDQVLQEDDSISIHACHSRLREVEVLKNLLLRALEQDVTLDLRDIVVMAPDIQVYEPFIDAAFVDIQHAVADRSLRPCNNALDAFIRFLSVSQSRFGWQTVLDLLEQQVIYPNFGLTETDLDLIKFWLQESQVRWGKSAKHKQELGLPEISENTWQASLDRLLMGYAVGTDDDFVADILPFIDVEGSSAEALGGLCAFMELLFKASNELKQAKSLKTWSSQLFYYADQLLIESDTLSRQQLNELLLELSELSEVHQDTVELQVIISWLEGMVAERKSANGFLRGQLTFCSMLPMRSIPFKVIALLGLNEGEFPRIDRNPTFDLLGQHFQKGDRSRRADDRYQFLEILLSARERLIMTYIGQSQSSNESIAPSVVISELLSVLEDFYQLKNSIAYHPLQAFSPRYFDGSSKALFSFSKSDLETAQAIVAPKPEPALWWHGSIPINTETENIIEIDELFRFFRHPQRYFMQRQLGLYFKGIEAKSEEREPFVINNLDAYDIYHQWIKDMLSDKEVQVNKIQAQGRWLSGAMGKLEFDRQHKIINDFALYIKAKNPGKALDDLAVDINISGYRIIGKLGNRYQNGSLFYRYTDLKGKDFICAWLHHTLINLVQKQQTFLLSTDEDLLLLPDYCQPEYLPLLLETYQLGLQRPDVCFVEAALAYVKQTYKLEKGRNVTRSSLEAASERLAWQIQQSYEPEFFRLYHNVADMGLILTDAFEQQCQQLWQPMWNASHQSGLDC